MFVELNTRRGDGLTVTLEWDRDTGQTQIVLHDIRADGLIAFGVPPANAEPLAFAAYQSALDREERAAKTYAGLMRRVRHLTETGLAHQLASIQAPPGAC